MNKSILQRVEHIEELLGNEPSPGKLSLALQESVDRIIRRGEIAEELKERKHGESARKDGRQ